MNRRILVVSIAHVHATAYLRTLARRADVDVRVWDREGLLTSDESATSLIEELGVAQVSDLAEAMSWRPDGIVLCTPTSAHGAAVRELLPLGAAILCEKPIATTLDEAVKIVRSCDAAGVPLMTAYPVRFHPAFAQLRAAVEAGHLGAPLALIGANNGGNPTRHRDWFGDPAQSGGGAVIDHTVHLANLVDELYGAAPVTVHAVANSRLAPESTVESSGLVTVLYDNGMTASIDCSWSVSASYPIWGGLSLRVEGTDRSVEFDAFDETSAFYPTQGPVRFQPWGPDLDALMLDEFLSVVDTGRAPIPDGWAGVRTLAIVDAAYRSIASGEVEPVRSI